MTRGIELTFQVIAKSKNQAAIGLLESAFQSTSKAVCELAGQFLISRRSRQSLEVIIRNFDPDDPHLVRLVNNNREILIPGLRGAIVDKDTTLSQQAFRLAYTQDFYEVLPTLAAYCLGPGKQEGDSLFLNNGFLQLLDKYAEALERNDPGEYRLLYGTLMPEFSRIFVQKIHEYRHSKHELTLTAYLYLYPFFSSARADQDLKLQLRLPNSPVAAAVYRRLIRESEPYLFQFVIRCLERLSPPPIVSQIVSERSDIPFLDAIFKSIKKPLSIELKTNLSNLPPLSWLDRIDSFLHQLDADAQCGLVLLLQNTKMPQDKLRSVLMNIFEHGAGIGRVTALSVLAGLSGDGIDRLIWDAAEDEDPMVQIEALTQLQARAIPNATTRIIQFVDSPHEAVRDTIQKLLPNFRFSRFMQTFDQLDDANRRRGFNIVRQLDKQTPKELTKMLSIGEPLVRAKALLCIDYCHEVVPFVEDALCDILARDELPQLRCKAAELLVAGQRGESRATLVQALHRDGSPDVRAAAKISLENRPSWFF